MKTFKPRETNLQKVFLAVLNIRLTGRILFSASTENLTWHVSWIVVPIISMCMYFSNRTNSLPLKESCFLLKYKGWCSGFLVGAFSFYSFCKTKCLFIFTLACGLWFICGFAQSVAILHLSPPGFLILGSRLKIYLSSGPCISPWQETKQQKEGQEPGMPLRASD